jgi:putative oxygen-independent coproporphyrinogen III oxidase
MTLPPLSLYVHFPWCVRKCPYCDFNSYTLRDELPEQRYVDALITDLQAQAESVKNRRLISVFLGGGTPSLFSPEAIHRVLECAQASIGFVDDIEVTMEANPGAVEHAKFAEYRAAGITRVSLGAQSFDAARLAKLGRIHSPDETRRAAEELHAAGLQNFNLDLMYALPDQDLGGAIADLDQAIALDPAHISHYQLTLEPGTVFAGAPPPLPDDDLAAEMLAVCQQHLIAAGFDQYEISAYARKDRQCRHNRNYWLFGDYLGVGAGAHGKISFENTLPMRTIQQREPRRYLAMAPHAITRTEVPTEELPFEFMLNALRLTDGFDESVFARHTGLNWGTVAPQMHDLAAAGLVVRAGSEWKASALGSRFLNDVLIRFLRPRAAGEKSTARIAS